MNGLSWLDPYDDDQPFPNPEYALAEPEGLLAIGGNLSPHRLLRAYRHGIFPWYCSGQPILWWSPNPRTVLFPEKIRISRSLRKTIRKGFFAITLDKAFDRVIQACSEPRHSDPQTWITSEMQRAYKRLHRLGYAHSVEIWHHRELVGGLYGVAIGRVFFGESMFHRLTDASKVALVALANQLEYWNFAVIDCQMYTGHLIRLGAETMPRRTFLELLRHFCPLPGPPSPWHLESDWSIQQP